MNKINIDLSTKVDIECREGDDFILDLNLTNQSTGNVYRLNESAAVFTIYNSLKKPILIAYGSNGSNDCIPVMTNSHVDENGDNISVTELSQKTAIALTNLLGAEIEDFNFFRFADYILKLATIDGKETINFAINATGNNLDCYSILESSIGLLIKVNSNRFKLPEGSYNYDLKIVSDIRSSKKITESEIENFSTDYNYKNVQTFLFGKIKVTKN